MEALMGIFIYLENTYGNNIIIDTMIPKVDTSIEIEKNWLENICDKVKKEEIPSNTPEPLGNMMSVNVFVYASHAGEKLTYRSHTGILVYVNNKPIYWFSKIQSTDKTSTFGAELIVARLSMEKVKSLRK